MGVLGIGLDTTRYYYLSVDSYSNPGGTFGISIGPNQEILYGSEITLWAVADGNWSDPSIWSETEGGASASRVPCEQTRVKIKGVQVSLNTTQPVSVKSIELIGTTNTSPTGLNVLNGLLVSREKIMISGAGVGLKSSATALIKVLKTIE